jgi:hypothetical protein
MNWIDNNLHIKKKKKNIRKKKNLEKKKKMEKMGRGVICNLASGGSVVATA